MAIPLVGTRGLFTRIGIIGRMLSDIRTFNGTTLKTDNTNLLAQYQSGTADEALIDGINNSFLSAVAGAESYMGFAQQVAVNTINYMVFLDNPQVSQNNLAASLAELIRQMKVSSDSVLAMTLGATVTAGSSNTGTGVCVATTYRKDGFQQDNLFAETVKVAVSSDSTLNSNLAKIESFNVTGTAQQSDVFFYDFPLGSGATTSCSAIDASSNNSNGNLLTNGDFETWTVTNVPDGFTITVGTAGTQVFRAATPYTGTYSLNFLGDGSTLTALTQQFNLAAGTLGLPTYQTIYAINCWIKMDVTPAAGVLEFALVDGSGTVVNDDQGNANLFTKSLTAVSTTWIPVNGSFRTPYVMPATIKLRVRLSTALTNARNLYVDRLAIGAMTQVYPGGGSVAVFSGATNFFIPDYFSVAFTNSRGAAGTLNTFQTLFDRLFSMRSLGLLLPTNASPTISDSLI